MIDTIDKKTRKYPNGLGKDGKFPGPGPGRPKGAKNKATLLREDMVRMYLAALTRKNEAANDKKEGDNYFDQMDTKAFNELGKTIVPRESKMDLTSSGKVLAAMQDKISKRREL